MISINSSPKYLSLYPMQQKYLIIIAGPTASGKTALSIDLAQHFDAEILSCDSRQFFKEMSIGTAKPDADELAAAPHHFINSLSIQEEYNIGDFERDVDAFLADYFQEKDIAIMVGGSGLYIKAVCEGLDHLPEVNASIRKDLTAWHEREGLTPLQKELEECDPVYYAKADIENPHRVIRALEICRGTGQPFSSFQGQKKAKKTNYNIIKLGIRWDREKLYERINLRVDLMLEQGLLEEVKGLYPHRALNALQTVGYQEIFDYMDGHIDLAEAIRLIKRNSRRYAKRQMTWFRKETDMIWIEAGMKCQDVIKMIEKAW